MDFKTFLEESKKEREFVFDKMENTEMDIDELEAAFKKKFGNTKNFQKYVGEFMD